MSPYIYTKRNGIHILDLQQTTRFIDEVHAYVHELVSQGKTILFVGTKKQAQDAIREEATKCGMPYINQRWLGGLLTNRETVRKRIELLRELRKQKEDGYFDSLPKKDQKRLQDTLDKLEKMIGGIADLNGLPDALFIVDVKKETNAVKEARRLMIPIIGILDTNCDPDDVQHKLPGNDDAIRSIRLFCQIIADSVMEAKYGYLPPDSVFIRAAEESAEDEKAAKQLEALGAPKKDKQAKSYESAPVLLESAEAPVVPVLAVDPTVEAEAAHPAEEPLAETYTANGEPDPQPAEDVE